jgi:outer membrane protein assembly factor BamB
VTNPRRELVGDILQALLFLALAALGIGIGILAWHLAGIDGGSTTAAAPTPPPPAATPPPPPRPKTRELSGNVVWPLFGFGPNRNHVAVGMRLQPPFRRVWSVSARSRVGFPPVVAYGRLFVATAAGSVLSIDAASGKVAWRKNLERCIRSSPAVGGGTVYVALMDRAPCPVHDEKQRGFLVALDAATGRTLWRFRSALNESSPLLARGVLYFGTWDGKVHALVAKTHRPLWTAETRAEVRASVAYSNGLVYVGSYDGTLYAFDAKTGAPRWSASPGTAIYSTPAVAAGRVFVGSTGGGVYAYDAESGSYVWGRTAGRAVYGSPAVWRDTVYVGSYDGTFYAFDAATGETRWQFAANGPISGSATVMAGIVYLSTLTGHTYGLDVTTGRQRWSFPGGQYSPLVADPKQAYVTTYSRIFALRPRE